VIGRATIDAIPDPALSMAARALSVGDPLAALKRVALRDDPPALALRGIAMAQLGDFVRARRLLGRAARTFGAGDAVAGARCIAAQAEIALACRDLVAADRGLDAAVHILARHGDLANALFGRLVGIRRLVLLGRVAAAGRALEAIILVRAPPRLIAIAELARADIAVRSLHTRAARAALGRARRAALASGIPSLTVEIDRALANLAAPAARLVTVQGQRMLRLDQVESVLASRALVVDACRRQVSAGRVVVSLVTRPVLFALALALARGAGAEVTRATLCAQAFQARRANASHRARLRVEIGRLRKLLGALAVVTATRQGFVLRPRRARPPVVLLPPGAGEGSAIVALLGAGEAWSTSGLAAALGKSQRTVQRALGVLQEAGQVRAAGAGRARRWVTPPSTGLTPGFATTLLLVPPGPLG
jgi:DNA-binding transcriptional ArsR family regulator